jgi:hypothetical protein
MMLGEHSFERLELGFPPGDGARVAGEKVIALLANQSRVIELGHLVLLSCLDFSLPLP